MKDYARAFYASKEWRKLSRLYMESKHYLCERCGGVGVICHHRRYITPRNINDTSITLNMENLECLCQDCHNREHTCKQSKAIFDENGNMIGAKESAEVQEYRQAVKAIEALQEAAVLPSESH